MILAKAIRQDTARACFEKIAHAGVRVKVEGRTQINLAIMSPSQVVLMMWGHSSR